MLLCSDGIYEFMTNDEIMALVHERAQQGSQPFEIAQHLVGPRNKLPLNTSAQELPVRILAATRFPQHVQAVLAFLPMFRGK